MEIKGVIFDLDGVITDSAEYHYHAWKNLSKELGITIDREFNEKLKGISRMDSLDRILAYGGKENVYSLAEKDELAAKKNDEYVQLIEDVTPKDLLPGIPEFLKELEEAGIQLALASASKNGPVILERLGLSDVFDTIVDPAQLKNGKPDPEIFIKGASQLGLSVDVCVGIEDAEAGIEAINKANMFSVGVGDAISMKEADYTVADTSLLSLTKIKEAFRK